MTRIRPFKFAAWLRLTLTALNPLLLLATLLAPAIARADQLSEDLAGLASTDSTEVSGAIVKAANRGDARALPALHALDDGKLRFDATKHLLIKGDSGLTDALTGAAATAQGKLEEPVSDNEVRRALSPALASLSLSAPSADVRLRAAKDLGRPSDEIVPILRKVLAKESNSDVRIALALALAPADMASDKPADRVRALQAIREAADATFKSDVERLLTKGTDGKIRRTQRRGASRGERGHLVDRDAPVLDQLRRQHVLRLEPRQRVDSVCARSGHHLRIDGRDQHGARRNDDDRRLHGVRGAKLFPGALRGAPGLVHRGLPCRRRSPPAAWSAWPWSAR